jgi:hypothetical protein
VNDNYEWQCPGSRRERFAVPDFEGLLFAGEWRIFWWCGGVAAADGSSPPTPGLLSAAPSGSWGVRPTTSSGYRAPLEHIRDPAPAAGSENPRGDDADNLADYKPAVGDGAEKADIICGSKGNGGSLSRRQKTETFPREQGKSEIV